MRAVTDGHTEVLQILIENRASVDARDSNQKTALISAAITGNKEVVQMLIENGASVVAADGAGYVAVHTIARKLGINAEVFDRTPKPRHCREFKRSTG